LRSQLSSRAIRNIDIARFDIVSSSATSENEFIFTANPRVIQYISSCRFEVFSFILKLRAKYNTTLFCGKVVKSKKLLEV
jgi:hypothetical protein